MKKSIVFSILLLSLLTFASTAAFALEATVVSVSGKVEVQKGSEWVAVKAGDVLQKGAVLSTGFKSTAELTIDSSSVSVGPLTRMTIEQLASNNVKSETQLYLDSGKVSANVKKPEGKRVDFKVSSPVATASVRGTEFTMGADGTLYTKSGLVSKSASTSPRARVAIEDTPSDFVPQDGESSAVTPTTAVSGSFGVPVFAGQNSRTDSLTGISTQPQAEHRNNARDIGGAAGSLASRERGAGIGTAGGGAGFGGGDPLAPEPMQRGELPKTGTLVIQISVPSSTASSDSSK